MKNRWLGILLLITMISTASYVVGIRLGQNSVLNRFPKVTPVQVNVNEGSGKPADFDLSVLWEAYRTLREKFVDQSKLDPKKLTEGAIAGFVSAAGDPYTIYVKPAEQQKFVENLEGSFGGIGAEIGIRKGVLVVIAPLAGSPAEKAGLKAGDRILKINDTFTADLSVDQAVDLIRGPQDTAVKLVILPENAEETKEVSIVRKVITVPSIKSEVKDGIGIIRIISFSSDSAKMFARAARSMESLPSKKIVIDLRSDPGGFLDASQEIASWFLPRGEVVVYEEDAGGNKMSFLSKGYKGLEVFKTVVLIDKGSASASEILAGALRDDIGAKLVGEKSYGKGSVQELMGLSDGSMLKITTAKWLTPKGTSINDEGLKPDMEVTIPPENADAVAAGDIDKDTQMQKALELLKAQ